MFLILVRLVTVVKLAIWLCTTCILSSATDHRFETMKYSTDTKLWALFSEYKRGISNFQWPPLWSSDQSSWLQIQRSGFDSRRHQIFWEAVGLERGPLCLVSTIVELLLRNSSGSGLENREYGRRDPSSCSRITLYKQKFALTSPTSGGHSVSIILSRTQATEFGLVVFR
jgi:hypothetical protein